MKNKVNINIKHVLLFLKFSYVKKKFQQKYTKNNQYENKIYSLHLGRNNSKGIKKVNKFGVLNNIARGIAHYLRRVKFQVKQGIGVNLWDFLCRQRINYPLSSVFR